MEFNSFVFLNLKDVNVTMLIQMRLSLFSCPVVSNSLPPCGLWYARPPVPHHLPEFAQVYVHWIGDTIQPSHPRMPSSPSALNLSQHQGLFQWVGCSRQMTKILELQLQHQSCQRVLSVDLRLPGLLSLLSRGLSGVFSSTTVWRHQFFGILEEGTANHSSILAIRTSRTDDSLGWLIYSFCTWAFSFSISILGHHPSRCKGTPWILLV